MAREYTMTIEGVPLPVAPHSLLGQALRDYEAARAAREPARLVLEQWQSKLGMVEEEITAVTSRSEEETVAALLIRREALRLLVQRAGQEMAKFEEEVARTEAMVKQHQGHFNLLLLRYRTYLDVDRSASLPPDARRKLQHTLIDTLTRLCELIGEEWQRVLG